MKLTTKLYNEIKEAFIQNKYLILISSLLFFIPLILGFILSSNLSSSFEPVVTQLSNDLKDGTIKFNFLTIFINNISIVFREYFMGIFLFILTAAILVYNGLFLGFYLTTTQNLLYSIIYIVPHGIFEFFSIIIAAASGFLLCIFILKFLYNLISPDYLKINKKTKLSLNDRITYSLDNNFIKFKQSLILLGISCISMIIAGFIEVYITLYLGKSIIAIFNL